MSALKAQEATNSKVQLKDSTLNDKHNFSCLFCSFPAQMSLVKTFVSFMCSQLSEG